MSKSGAKSDKVRFQDPPPPQRGSAPYDWAAIAERLRASPGEWALVFEQDKTTYVTAIRNGGITALSPYRGFQVTTANNRREPSRVCDLYVRYVESQDYEKKESERG